MDPTVKISAANDTALQPALPLYPTILKQNSGQIFTEHLNPTMVESPTQQQLNRLRQGLLAGSKLCLFSNDDLWLANRLEPAELMQLVFTRARTFLEDLRVRAITPSDQAEMAHLIGALDTCEKEFFEKGATRLLRQEVFEHLYAISEEKTELSEYIQDNNLRRAIENYDSHPHQRNIIQSWHQIQRICKLQRDLTGSLNPATKAELATRLAYAQEDALDKEELKLLASTRITLALQATELQQQYTSRQSVTEALTYCLAKLLSPEASAPESAQQSSEYTQPLLHRDRFSQALSASKYTLPFDLIGNFLYDIAASTAQELFDSKVISTLLPDLRRAENELGYLSNQLAEINFQLQAIDSRALILQHRRDFRPKYLEVKDANAAQKESSERTIKEAQRKADLVFLKEAQSISPAARDLEFSAEEESALRRILDAGAENEGLKSSRLSKEQKLSILEKDFTKTQALLLLDQQEEARKLSTALINEKGQAKEVFSQMSRRQAFFLGKCVPLSEFNADLKPSGCFHVAEFNFPDGTKVSQVGLSEEAFALLQCPAQDKLFFRKLPEGKSDGKTILQVLTLKDFVVLGEDGRYHDIAGVEHIELPDEIRPIIIPLETKKLQDSKYKDSLFLKDSAKDLERIAARGVLCLEDFVIEEVRQVQSFDRLKIQEPTPGMFRPQGAPLPPPDGQPLYRLDIQEARSKFSSPAIALSAEERLFIQHQKDHSQCFCLVPMDAEELIRAINPKDTKYSAQDCFEFASKVALPNMPYSTSQSWHSRQKQWLGFSKEAVKETASLSPRVYKIITQDQGTILGIVLSDAAKEQLIQNSRDPEKKFTPILLRRPCSLKTEIQTQEAHGIVRVDASPRCPTKYAISLKFTPGCEITAKDFLWAKAEQSVGEEHFAVLDTSGSKKSIGQSTLKDLEAARADFKMAISHSKAVNQLDEKCRRLFADFFALQELLDAAANNSDKSEELVGHIKVLSTKLRYSYESQGFEGQKEELKKILSDVHSVFRSLSRDQFDAELAAFESRLSFIVSLVENKTIFELDQQVKSLRADTLTEWVKTSGMILTVSIAVGTLSVTMLPTGGLSGMALVGLTSFYSAVGGYVGGQIGKGMVSLYDEDIHSDWQMFYEGKLTFADCMFNMGSEVFWSTLQGALIVGSGSLLGKWAKETNLRSTKVGFKSYAARSISHAAEKLEKAKKLISELDSQESFRVLVEIAEEYYEETGENFFTALAGQADKTGNPWLAGVLRIASFSFSTLNCAGGPAFNFAGESHTTKRQRKVEGDVETHVYDFSGTVESLKRDLHRSGMLKILNLSDTSADADGVIRIEKTEEVVQENGSKKKRTTVHEFHPTKEANCMRILLAASRDKKTGRSVLVDVFGQTLRGDGSHSCKTDIAPDGRTLKDYYEAQGFWAEYSSDRRCLQITNPHTGESSPIWIGHENVPPAVLEAERRNNFRPYGGELEYQANRALREVQAWRAKRLTSWGDILSRRRAHVVNPPQGSFQVSLHGYELAIEQGQGQVLLVKTLDGKLLQDAALSAEAQQALQELRAFAEKEKNSARWVEFLSQKNHKIRSLPLRVSVGDKVVLIEEAYDHTPIVKNNEGKILSPAEFAPELRRPLMALLSETQTNPKRWEEHLQDLAESRPEGENLSAELRKSGDLAVTLGSTTVLVREGRNHLPTVVDISERALDETKLSPDAQNVLTCLRQDLGQRGCTAASIVSFLQAEGVPAEFAEDGSVSAPLGGHMLIFRAGAGGELAITDQTEQVADINSLFPKIQDIINELSDFARANPAKWAVKHQEEFEAIISQQQKDEKALLDLNNTKYEEVREPASGRLISYRILGIKDGSALNQEAFKIAQDGQVLLSSSRTMYELGAGGIFWGRQQFLSTNAMVKQEFTGREKDLEQNYNFALPPFLAANYSISCQRIIETASAGPIGASSSSRTTYKLLVSNRHTGQEYGVCEFRQISDNEIELTNMEIKGNVDQRDIGLALMRSFDAVTLNSRRTVRVDLTGSDYQLFMTGLPTTAPLEATPGALKKAVKRTEIGSLLAEQGFSYDNACFPDPSRPNLVRLKFSKPRENDNQYENHSLSHSRWLLDSEIQSLSDKDLAKLARSYWDEYPTALGGEFNWVYYAPVGHVLSGVLTADMVRDLRSGKGELLVVGGGLGSLERFLVDVCGVNPEFIVATNLEPEATNVRPKKTAVYQWNYSTDPPAAISGKKYRFITLPSSLFCQTRGPSGSQVQKFKDLVIDANWKQQFGDIVKRLEKLLSPDGQIRADYLPLDAESLREMQAECDRLGLSLDLKAERGVVIMQRREFGSPVLVQDLAPVTALTPVAGTSKPELPEGEMTEEGSVSKDKLADRNKDSVNPKSESKEPNLTAENDPAKLSTPEKENAKTDGKLEDSTPLRNAEPELTHQFLGNTQPSLATLAQNLRRTAYQNWRSTANNGQWRTITNQERLDAHKYPPPDKTKRILVVFQDVGIGDTVDLKTILDATARTYPNAVASKGGCIDVSAMRPAYFKRVWQGGSVVGYDAEIGAQGLTNNYDLVLIVGRTLQHATIGIKPLIAQLCGEGSMPPPTFLYSLWEKDPGEFVLSDSGEFVFNAKVDRRPDPNQFAPYPLNNICFRADFISRAISGIDTTEVLPSPLMVSEKERLAARQSLQEMLDNQKSSFVFNEQTKLILVNPFSSDPLRQLPMETIQAGIIKAATQLQGQNVLILVDSGPPKDSAREKDPGEEAQSIVKEVRVAHGADAPVLLLSKPLADQTETAGVSDSDVNSAPSQTRMSTNELITFCAIADGTLTVDSAAAHFAPAAGRPTVIVRTGLGRRAFPVSIFQQYNTKIFGLDCSSSYIIAESEIRTLCAQDVQDIANGINALASFVDNESIFAEDRLAEGRSCVSEILTLCDSLAQHIANTGEAQKEPLATYSVRLQAVRQARRNSKELFKNIVQKCLDARKMMREPYLSLERGITLPESGGDLAILKARLDEKEGTFDNYLRDAFVLKFLSSNTFSLLMREAALIDAAATP